MEEDGLSYGIVAAIVVIVSGGLNRSYGISRVGMLLKQAVVLCSDTYVLILKSILIPS